MLHITSRRNTTPVSPSDKQTEDGPHALAAPPEPPNQSRAPIHTPARTSPVAAHLQGGEGAGVAPCALADQAIPLSPPLVTRRPPPPTKQRRPDRPAAALRHCLLGRPSCAATTLGHRLPALREAGTMPVPLPQRVAPQHRCVQTIGEEKPRRHLRRMGFGWPRPPAAAREGRGRGFLEGGGARVLPWRSQ